MPSGLQISSPNSPLFPGTGVATTRVLSGDYDASLRVFAAIAEQYQPGIYVALFGTSFELHLQAFAKFRAMHSLYLNIQAIRLS